MRVLVQLADGSSQWTSRVSVSELLEHTRDTSRTHNTTFFFLPPVISCASISFLFDRLRLDLPAA